MTRAFDAGAVRWLTIALLLLLWEIAARTVGDPSFVAPPSAVAAHFTATVFGDPAVTRALGVAILETIVAFVLSVLVGIAVGIAIGLTDLGRRSFFPFVLLLYGIPQVVLLPLVILVFGLGPPSRIAFGFTHGVLPVVVTTVAGMRSVNPLFLASAHSLGASRALVVRHIVIPTMIASVSAGLRLAMSLTLLGVVLAELYVSTNGIGNFTQVYAETFKPAALYALVLVLALAAVALNALVGLVEARFSGWQAR